MPAGPNIPPLVSGGVMLTWRCSNACRHCLYRCGPDRPNDWMTLDAAERVFAALAGEPRLGDVHLAGGEATLDFDRLLDVIAVARRHRVPISYLETNAVWCVDDATTERKMTALAEAGLRCVLISASPFHNEFIPFARTRRCVAAAERILGPGGAFVWVDPMYRALAQLPAERTHTLEEFLQRANLAERPQTLRQLYPMTPGGRVVERLRECFTAQPMAAFEGESCAAELASTQHFHIDPNGNLFTGHCPGIAVATIDDLHPPVSAETHPITTALWQRGPAGLVELAGDAFEPRPEGYVSKCDLCLHARHVLRATGRYNELRPDAFYQEDRP